MLLKALLCFLFLIILLFSSHIVISMAQLASVFSLFFFILGGTLVMVNGQQTWCVAKPSSEQATLLANINFACSHVDCGVMQKGCPCYSPDNLMNHASVAMNLYYQANGRQSWNCDFRGSALTVITNPSYADCIYDD